MTAQHPEPVVTGRPGDQPVGPDAEMIHRGGRNPRLGLVAVLGFTSVFWGAVFLLTR